MKRENITIELFAMSMEYTTFQNIIKNTLENRHGIYDSFDYDNIMKLNLINKKSLRDIIKKISSDNDWYFYSPQKYIHGYNDNNVRYTFEYRYNTEEAYFKLFIEYK